MAGHECAIQEADQDHLTETKTALPEKHLSQLDIDIGYCDLDDGEVCDDLALNH